MTHYQPPKQSSFGQIVDSIFLLVLVYVALLLPLVVDFSGAEEQEVVAESTTALTWEALGQNETMQAQWESLGLSIDEAAEIINDKFDYSINPISLLLTALVIIGYFFFLFKFSDAEYRDVLKEKFDKE